MTDDVGKTILGICVLDIIAELFTMLDDDIVSPLANRVHGIRPESEKAA